MADNTNFAVETLYDIAKMGGDEVSGAKRTLHDTPNDVLAALNVWLDEVNITLDDIDPDVYVGSWFDDEHTFYAFTFDVTDPEIFVGTVAIGAVGDGRLGVLGVSSSGTT